MRYNQIRPLVEYKQSPTSLEQVVKDLDARVGIEFEFCYPEIDAADIEKTENDYTNNDMPKSIPDVYEFFSKGMDTNELKKLIRKMFNEYDTWLEHNLNKLWQKNKDTFIQTYLELHSMPDRANDVSNNPSLVMHQKIRQLYFDMIMDDNGEEHFQKIWLIKNGVLSYSDLCEMYNFEWPYKTQSSGKFWEHVSNELSKYLGLPVDTAKPGSTQTTAKTNYFLTVDPSIDPYKNDYGLELITPDKGLPLAVMQDHYKKIKRWLDEKKCYTNDTTGLHINIDIPNYSIDNLDYVKFIIFSNDQAVLKDFDRAMNPYAMSSLMLIKSKIKNDPGLISKVFTTLKQRLNTAAGQLIHSGATQKQFSLHIKKNYVEIRSPGNDWLSLSDDELFFIINRYIVALDAACDPNKHSREYAKKLYKLLTSEIEDSEILEQFSLFAANKITMQNLASKVAKANRILPKE